ncbi:MAG: 6-phosphofructokinase [Flavobacteriales bacterium]|nr:6-phosphofructokinase [Flavobacteriales bacterium]
MLCAGGPAPGINTVVASITKRFLADDYRIIGLNHGYSTLFKDKTTYIELTYEIADRIYSKGGSYLKMSRYKPKNEEFNDNFFKKENITLLVTIGGDDTASTANRISIFLEEKNIKIQNIHVPKTIDNDLPLPVGISTFGYQTAKNEGSRLAKTILEDGRSTDAWFIVSAMGREAGHLALGIGKACRYPLVIIPEMFHKTKVTFDGIMKLIVSTMVKRKLMGLYFGGVVISEGVFHFIDDDEIKNTGIDFSYDDHGHPELGLLSKAHIFNQLLGVKLKELNLDIKCRPVEIGYAIRCADPTAYDLRFCTNLGYGVKELYENGDSKCIVISTPAGAYKALSMKDISNAEGVITPRLVNMESQEIKSALKSFETLREKDFEEAKLYLPDPENYTMKSILSIDL